MMKISVKNIQSDKDLRYLSISPFHRQKKQGKGGMAIERNKGGYILKRQNELSSHHIFCTPSFIFKKKKKKKKVSYKITLCTFHRFAI